MGWVGFGKYGKFHFFKASLSRKMRQVNRSMLMLMNSIVALDSLFKRPKSGKFHFQKMLSPVLEILFYRAHVL